MRKLPRLLTSTVLLGAWALAGSAWAQSQPNGYLTHSSGNWSTATWEPWWGTAPVPANGPGAADCVNVFGAIIYDSGASGRVGSLYVGYGGSGSLTLNNPLTVLEELNVSTLNVNGVNFSDTGGGWHFTGFLNASNGAVVTIGPPYWLAGGDMGRICLDNTSRLNITGGACLRSDASRDYSVDFLGSSVTVTGNLTADGCFGEPRIILNVVQNPGQKSGMTLDGALTYKDYGTGSRLNLVFDAGSFAGDWIFRKKEAADSLTALVDSGFITVSGAEYEIVNNGTHTVIQATGVGAGTILTVR